MATTNVPLPTFEPAGLAIPAEQDVLAGVQADWVSAFAPTGRTLSTALTTPQGQLQQSQAYMVANFNAALAALVANVDPLTAQGAFQDALGRIYFLTRKGATYATVPATVYGTVGQVLPAGAQAKSSDGSLWVTTGAATFGPAGDAQVTFRAQVAGSAPDAGVNDLTIYQQQPGWESVSNSIGSTPGADVESRQSFEQRRAESVSIGGLGQPSNVRAAVANVEGVTDVYVYNNGGDTAITYGATNYPIPAHSIAICVAGGADADVAAAINAKLDCGCGLPTSAGEGTLVTYTVQDAVNYEPPYPSYVVRFVRAAPTQIYISVAVANVATLPVNYVALVQEAVASAFANGYQSGDGAIVVGRARMGAQIVAAAYAPAILALGNITPITLHVGFAAAPTTGDAVTMGIDQQPVCPAVNVSVTAVAV